MYKIMYKLHESNEWKCIGAYTDQIVAVNEMDKLEQGVLGKYGSFKMVREGSKDETINNKQTSIRNGNE